MIQKIEIFVLVLSVLYWIMFLFRFFTVIKEDNPEPMALGTFEKVLLYLSSSYIITGIITLFL